MYRLIFSFIIFTNPFLSGQDIFINEFMASNDTTITDPYYHLSGDWIEIYNAGQYTVNLQNHYLTDDPSDSTKWRIENELILEPDAYLIIWADGFNQDYHASFKLAREGEFIGIYSPELQVIDSLSYTTQETDISYGRYPDGGKEWFYFDHPSPGSTNGADGSTNIASPAQFSIPSGKYEASVNIAVTSGTDSVQIYYTKDGSIPDKNSILYIDHIHVRSSTTIRAIVYRDGYLPSRVITKTYLMFIETELPIMAISSDPDNFFDDQIGIYVEGTNGIPGYCSSEPRNWNQDWERPAHVDFFDEDGRHLIDQDVGVKISGGCSRLYPQKSLEIVARNKYGDDRFRYRMFADKPVHEFKNFILRSSAQDWWRSMIRDGLLHTLVSKTMDLDYQAYRPAVVYLNGEYWGIHNIREKSNESYLYYNHGLDPENLDIVKISKYGYATAGDIEAYTQLMNFVSENDLSQADNYAHVSDLIDIDNYLNYQIYEIYIANRDWPGNNLKLYRERVDGSKWRWWLYDLDMGFGGNGEAWYDSNILAQATDDDGPNWPNPPWSTLLFRRLLENENFRNDFIQRFAVYLSATFKPEFVVSVIDSIRQKIASEIPRHKQRWPKSISYASTWQKLLDIIYEFAYRRPEYMIDHLKAKFSLADQVPVIIESNILDAGQISAHGIMINHTVDTLDMFPNLPLELNVQALPGYNFLHWEIPELKYLNKIVIIPDKPMTIKAVFASDTSQSSPIVINEINYNSATFFDPGDWVELYNNSGEHINISGWYFRDSQNTDHFAFPSGTEINKNGYLVLCRDTTRFKEHFPGVKQVIGNFPFGLSVNGELIRLYSDIDLIVDSLTYENKQPWPEAGLGEGHTVALKHPRLDNSLGVNWKTSDNHGTPGEINDAFLDVEKDKDLSILNTFTLEQNYPNPFNNHTMINYTLPHSGEVKFAVYDTRGRIVYTSTRSHIPPGRHTINWQVIKELASGVYFYAIHFSGKTLTRKFIYLK